MPELHKMRQTRKIKSKGILSQLSHQLRTAPQIHKFINHLIFNQLPSQFPSPNIAKIIVKNFLGHFTHNSLNQPLASKKLSHSKPKIVMLQIIVKNFLGHFTHNSLNQPIKCQKLSHLNPKIVMQQIIVKNFVGHSTHKSVSQPVISQKLSHVPHHSIQKSQKSKEYEKINSLIISQLPSPSPCPNIAKNIVKKFVGHSRESTINQPLASQNLSHALPSIPLCPQIILEIWDSLGNNHTEKSLLNMRMLRLWFSIPTIEIVKTRFNNASNILAINEFE
jgi:hypothetical protein